MSGASFDIIAMRAHNTYIFHLPVSNSQSIPRKAYFIKGSKIFYMLRKFRRKPDSVSNSSKIFIYTYFVVREIYTFIFYCHISNHDAVRKSTHNN